ncbi:MAG: ABC transporter ATP-binding protein, partial [Pseudomonadota bacterium]
MSVLEITNLRKSYGSGSKRSEVLGGINLKVEEGEFVAIVGFSGSGKTTLISAIAGLIKPDSGEILCKGQKVTRPAPARGVVFQNYSLMPWLTVYGNIALAVDTVFSDWPKDRREAHTRKYIEMVGLPHAVERYPSELSGGMRQRVAVARALAMQPEILLLDEPLSALDALTRSRLQDELAAISLWEKKTIILITNDVDEAIILADRIIPLDPGPNAVLGPEFTVNLPRPRGRGKLNNDPAFKKLRQDITAYLVQKGAARAGLKEENYSLPKITPLDLRAAMPKAAKLAGEARSLHLDRFLDIADISKT